MANNLQFVYPKYSEFYLKKKREFEAELEDRLKALNDFQPFYEIVTSVLKKHPIEREVQLREGASWIRVNFRLLPNDSYYDIVNPILTDVCKALNIDVPKGYYYYGAANISWTVYGPKTEAKKGVIPTRSHFSLQVDLPEAGCKDVQIVKVPRTTVTSEYQYSFLGNTDLINLP